MKRISQIMTIVLVLLMLFGCSSNSNHTNSTETTAEEKIQLSAEEIYSVVSPSTVEITAESETHISTGTGFIYDDNGVVVTNYHVVKGCSSGYISISDGGKYDINFIIGYSEELDIAILQTAYKNGVPLEIRTDEVSTGEKVYAVGSSLGLSGTFSDGIVSSAMRDIEGTEYIQITTPISEGNSGGPLVDTYGEVVGITSASIVDGQNVNLAIPISKIEKVTKFSVPMTMEDLFVEKNPYDQVTKYLTENGTLGKYFNKYYHEVTDTGHMHDSIGSSLEISYRENPDDLINDEFESAVVLVLRSYDSPSDCGEAVLTSLSIYLYPDFETCDILFEYHTVDGTIAEGTVAIFDIEDLPINDGSINVDEEIIEGDELDYEDILDVSDKVIQGVDDALSVYDSWLYKHNIGCGLSDFGIYIH